MTVEAGKCRRYVKRAVSHLNFYRAHLLYFVLVIVISSVILYGSSTSEFSLAYIDAIYLCTSAMCNIGLTSVNLGSLTGFQQSIMFVLMIMGKLTIVSISVVVLRRYYFRKRIKELVGQSATGRRVAEEIEEEREDGSGDSGGSDGQGTSAPSRLAKEDRILSSRSRKESPGYERTPADYLSLSHRTEYGAFPAPWNSHRIKNLWASSTHGKRRDTTIQPSYLSFKPTLDRKGRFVSLSPRQEEELGGVEYRASKLLTWLLPAYCAFWWFVVMVVITPYAAHTHTAEIIRSEQPSGLNPAWWSVFVSVSAYTDCGMNLLNRNMIPLAHDYLVLIFTGAAILAGNTMYPVFLRFFIWLLSKCVRRSSELRHTLTFLLQHSRRCYLLLFPSKSTWILFAAQVAINMTAWVFWIILDFNQPAVDSGIPPGQRVMDGLYQVHGVRSTGFYIIKISEVAPELQILYMALFYTSAFPLVMSMRQSNIYEERTLGQDDTQKAGDDENDPQRSPPSTLGKHVRRQLSYDVWYLFACVFLICIIEHDNLNPSQPGFTIFSVVFEVISAYGNVGLSLGIPHDNYSFSGAWHVLSKLILLTVMLRGRHRILPMAIDRAVLLPGEELMQKLDKRFHGTEERRDLEARIRRDEKGSQAKLPGRTQQDPE